MEENLKRAVSEQMLLSLREGCERRGVAVVVAPDMALAELGLDSLHMVEMVFELESYYEVQADEELLVQLQSVADVIDMFVVAVGSVAAPVETV